MRVYLRIKLLSLPAESKIIRKEMLKYDGPSAQYQGLHLHRTREVREESRATQIAIGFLRGKTYKQIEAKCHVQPNWKRVQKLVETYGEGNKEEIRERFLAWKAA